MATEFYTVQGITPEADFCIIAEDNSLASAGIRKGSAVFFQVDTPTHSSDIVAVETERGLAIQRVSFYTGATVFRSDYGEQVFTAEVPRIIGRAVFYQSNL